MTAPSSPPPDSVFWLGGPPRPRYRVLARIIDGKTLYYPQHRGWFFWHDYPDTPSNGGGRIYFDVKEAAVQFLEHERFGDRKRKAEKVSTRVVVEMEE